VAVYVSNGVRQVLPALGHGVQLDAEEYDALRGPLPALRLSFDEQSAAGGGLLRQVGPPPGWEEPRPPDELLGPLVRAAAERARRLALAEPEDESPPGQRLTSAPPGQRLSPASSRPSRGARRPARACCARRAAAPAAPVAPG
jgi:hypothetical protein